MISARQAQAGQKQQRDGVVTERFSTARLLRGRGVRAMGATGAAAAVGGATGIRAWLAAQGFAWMTRGRMRVTTLALLAMGVIGASVGVSGA